MIRVVRGAEKCKALASVIHVFFEPSSWHRKKCDTLLVKVIYMQFNRAPKCYPRYHNGTSNVFHHALVIPITETELSYLFDISIWNYFRKRGLALHKKSDYLAHRWNKNYNTLSLFWQPVPLIIFVQSLRQSHHSPLSEAIAYLCSYYVAHEFDIT